MRIIVELCVLASVAFFVLLGILNFITGIIYFGRPELYCSNCGKKVTKKFKKCPHCKVKLK